jgi:multidrug resistance efflux pump
MVKGSDGQLSASLFNYQTGVSEGYRASNFDQGSSVHFALNPAMIPGHYVSQGDTVGVATSSEAQERLISLNGQLDAARGQLAVSSTGEKAVVIHADEERLEFARRRREEEEKSFARTKTLYEQGLLPVSQYEAAENQIHAANDAVALAEASLEESRTGAKPEELGLVHSRIAALEEEIAALERRTATYTITAPLSGRIARSSTSDVLLTISDTTRYVAMIPVRLIDLPRLAAAPDARVTLRGLPREVHGTVVAVDQEVSTIGTEKVVIATAVLERTSVDLVLGLAVRCDIDCRPVSMVGLIQQFLMSLVV